MIVLTLDPSFSATGWAVVEITDVKFKVIAVGCIKTSSKEKKKTFKFIEKTRQLVTGIKNVLLDYPEVTEIISEIPVGSQSSSAIQALAACHGIVSSVAVLNNLDVKWVSAKDVKEYVVGDRNAEKHQVEQAVLTKLPQCLDNIKHKYAREAIADALACCIFTYS